MVKANFAKCMHRAIKRLLVEAKCASGALFNSCNYAAGSVSDIFAGGDEKGR